MKFHFKPYSNNIVFLDTEFSTNDPKNAELMSFGLVKLNGEELYIELEYNGEVSDWVKDNVLPYLKEDKVAKSVAVKKIKDFIGKDRSFPIAFVNVYDMVYLYRFFGSISQTPFFWPPIDFASILFANEIDPNSYYKDDKNNFFKEIGIDVSKYVEHNALDDARLLREVFLKMTER